MKERVVPTQSNIYFMTAQGVLGWSGSRPMKSSFFSVAVAFSSSIELRDSSRVSWLAVDMAGS